MDLVNILDITYYVQVTCFNFMFLILDNFNTRAVCVSCQFRSSLSNVLCTVLSQGPWVSVLGLLNTKAACQAAAH